jgi:hypothetical protein
MQMLEIIRCYAVVNKDIFNTLQFETEFEFWWLNNGITILL